MLTGSTAHLQANISACYARHLANRAKEKVNTQNINMSGV